MPEIVTKNCLDKIIIFTRYPQPGATKTRLIPAIGAQKAACLQKKMTEQVVVTAQRFAARHGIFVEVRYTGAVLQQMKQWLPPDMFYQNQGDGDLGNRLERAFAESFDRHFERVIVVGSDCPALSVEILKRAFALLEKDEIVLGPAHDGGYYLIGLRRHFPDLFENIPWGSENVLAATSKQAKKISAAIKLLPPLADIDRPEDLENCPISLQD